MERVLIVLLLHIFTLYFFNKGFFLSRVELVNKSSCTELPYLFSVESHREECWFGKKTHDKAILILIDALRYDFITRVETNQEIYHNNLPIIQETLISKPKQTFVSKLFADPPTTTLQRLKGITTGGLPTFLEFKDDFSKDMYISEDNIFSQILDQNLNITVMGDDTWLSVYSKETFVRSFPFDSFDVKDIFTVDNGVKNHIFDEIRKKDSQVIVGHFLGVDHVGHTYGPNNKIMKEKLQEMNGVLEQLVSDVDDMEEDCVLIVFGDHGMTTEGNHGGASDLETGAGLFVYSNKNLRDANDSNFEDRVVNQVDLIPTLAAFLGVAAPFGNLGILIPEMFHSELRQDQLRHGLEINLAQVVRYLQTYKSKVSSFDFDFNELEKLYLNPLKEVEVIKSKKPISRQMTHIVQYFIPLLERIDFKNGEKNMFQNILQKDILEKTVKEFNRGKTVSDTQVLSILEKYQVMLMYDCLNYIAERTRETWTQFNQVYMFVGIVCSVGPILFLLLSIKTKQITSKYLVILVVMAASLLSNSFIEAEEQVITFLLTFLLLFDSFIQLQNTKQVDWKAVGPRLFYVLAFRSTELIFSNTLLIPVFLTIFLWSLFTPMSRDIPGILYASFVKVLLLFQCVFTIVYLLDLETPVSRNMFALISYFIIALRFFSNDVRCGKKIPISCCLFYSFFFPIILVTGKDYVPVLCSAFCALSILRCYELPKFSIQEQSLIYSLTMILIFFKTGHACTLDKIQVIAGYVGLEKYNYYLCAVLIGLNQFGGYILTLTVAATPIHLPKKEKQLDAKNVLEHVLFIFSLRLVITMCFTFFARRHLMVWRLFAPKYAYEIVYVLFIDAFVLLLFMFSP
eukprot:snap_masked-scaffold_2-processed-gene-17.21-mRNA-1 protein AED:0.08 eAED:0.08 QI:0/0/0/1/1/1/2/0/853